MEHETAGNVAEDILSVQEEKQLIYVADLLKAKGIGKECALWTCISAADAGKLEEYIQFVENASLTEAILHEWEQKNIQRPSKLYEYEEGLEYEFVGFEEDWRRMNLTYEALLHSALKE